MPFEVRDPRTIDLIKKTIALQTETTDDMKVIADSLLQCLAIAIVSMAEYNPQVAQTLFHTIGNNLGDLIVEEMKNQPSNITFPEVTSKWKM